MAEIEVRDRPHRYRPVARTAVRGRAGDCPRHSNDELARAGLALHALDNLEGLSTGQRRWLEQRVLGLSFAPMTLPEIVTSFSIDTELAEEIDDELRERAEGLITVWRGLLVPVGAPWNSDVAAMLV